MHRMISPKSAVPNCATDGAASCIPIRPDDGSGKRPNQSAFIFKPTDACFNDLMLAVASMRKGVNNAPAINFDNRVLTFENGRSHSFALEAFDSRDYFEALTDRMSRTSNGGGSGGLSFQSLICGRVQVGATDEVFDATRKRAMQIAETKANHQTKEIKTTSRTMARNVRLNRVLATSGAAAATASSSKPPLTPVKPVAASVLAGKTLRQRVLHLLAVEAYTFKDLFARLSNDGGVPLGAAERKTVGEIVRDVARQVGRENKWMLNRFASIVAELERDWPAYTSEERTRLERFLAGEVTNVVLNGGGTHSVPQTGSVVDGATGDGDYKPGTKRKRQMVGLSTYLQPNKRVAASPPLASDGVNDRAPAKVAPVRRQPSKSAQSSPAFSGVANAERKSPSSTHSSPTCSSMAKDDADAAVLVRQFEAEFPPISTHDERTRYKAAFDVDYADYLAAHARVAAFAERFKRLQMELGALPAGSDDRSRREADVLRQHDEALRDGTLQAAKKRYRLLRSKLQVLKARVAEYDRGYAEAVALGAAMEQESDSAEEKEQMSDENEERDEHLRIDEALMF